MPVGEIASKQYDSAQGLMVCIIFMIPAETIDMQTCRFRAPEAAG